MILLLLSTLLLPAGSRAADFCTAVPLLNDNIFFCEDNPTYAKYADACKEQFRALAKAKSLELRKVLVADIGAAAGEAQTTHFKTTQVSYESTDRTLAQTIDIGRHARAEVAAYGDDFVAPFSWPWMDLGPFPGLHDPQVQELFRSVGCYKDNMESIERTEADFDQMIRDLEATRATAAQLHQRARGRELKLADLSALTPIGGGRLSGHSYNRESDVTGTGRPQVSLASKPGNGTLAAPKFAGAASGSRASDVTRAPAAAGTGGLGGSGHSAQAEAAMVRAFTPNLNPAPGSGDDDDLKDGDSSRSVGSALWAPAGTSLALGSSATSWTPAGIGNAADEAALAGTAAASTAAVAGRDRDLFSLVRERYRASELFRLARP